MTPETSDLPIRSRSGTARILDMLTLIAEQPGSFALGQIAARAGLPPSSAHRMLQAFGEAGFVERADTRRYRAGAELLRIAALLQRQIEPGRQAHPELEALWDRWGETCSLCAYRPARRRALVVDSIAARLPTRVSIEPFSEIALTWGSLGRVILAWLAPAEIRAALNQQFAGSVTGRRTAAARLRPELAAIRSAGRATYRNAEFDLAGVAAPIFADDGTVTGSIGVGLPLSRAPSDWAEAIGHDVLEAASRLRGIAFESEAGIPPDGKIKPGSREEIDSAAASVP